MRKWQVYLAAAALVLLLPEGQGSDVGKLQPAELVYIYKENDAISVCTDTGDLGSGETLPGALKDMQETSPGILFLDTVDYILITEETKNVIPELEEYFRPSSAVILATGTIDVERATRFLSVHEPDSPLTDCVTENVQLPKLMTAEERYYLEQAK